MTKKIDTQILTHIASAISTVDSNKSRAQKLINKARKIAMKKTNRLPLSIKSQFCKNCNAPLVLGKNCKVRINKGRAILHCNSCKTMRKSGGKKKFSGY